MLRVAHLQEKKVVCMLCGRPAESAMCLGCMARVRGEALEAKRTIEKKGRPEATRH